MDAAGLTSRDETAEPGRDAWKAMLRKARRMAEAMAGRKGIEGFVDRVLAGEVTGWAFDPNKPDRRVHVSAWYDGRIIAEALADLPRKDLAQNGKGDGRHAFILRLPAAVLDGEPRKLRIEGASGGVRVLLKRGVITVASARPGAHPQRIGKTALSPGVIEAVTHGALHGWAAHPTNPAPATVDIYDDERYLGSVTADKPRPRLQEQGAPPNARGFVFKLPGTVDAARVGRLRARITGAHTDLQRSKGYPGPGFVAAEPAPPALNGPPARPEPVQAPDALIAPRVVAPRPKATMRAALLLVGPGETEALRRSTRSWAAQAWPDLAIGSISADPGAPSEGENRFHGADSERLQAFIAAAHTVVIAPAGETFDPVAARLLTTTRPGCDVLTWTGQDGGPEPEGPALAVLLGRSWPGLAVRPSALATLGDGLARDLAEQGLRRLQLRLAANPALRWSHVPARLSSPGRPTDGAMSESEAADLPAFIWRAAADGRPSRLHPSAATPGLSIGIWPQWTDASLRTLESLLSAEPVSDIEILMPTGEGDSAREAEIQARFDGDAASRISIRRFDPPQSDTPGAWLRALGEAAVGQVILFCRAGLTLAQPDARDDLAQWAKVETVGAVTAQAGASGGELAGVALESSDGGWRAVSAFDPARPGERRPVLAAPAQCFAVARDKLAAAGGIDLRRFPDSGADLDLCLRLRRMGLTNLLLGDIRFDGDPGAQSPCGEAELGAFEAGELAAASAACPAPRRSSRS